MRTRSNIKHTRQAYAYDYNIRLHLYSSLKLNCITQYFPN
jgi:hypothetical protein